MLRRSILRALALAGLMLALPAIEKAQTAGPRALIAQAIDENRLVTLTGNTRPEAKSQNDLGPAGDDLHLDMYLQLKRSPEQELAAAQFVESLTDKTSPNFHKWITAAEYGRRFGAASADIASITRWLESHGFTVNGVPANNMVIDFSGNAGQVREALHTEIHNLQIGGERHFANMSDPQIPAALLPAVSGVVSLNNFKPQPMFVPRTQYTVNPNFQLLVPGDLATIYNLNPAFAGGYTGQGQTIVVVEDTDLYTGTGDWNVFRKTFGLTQYAYGSLTQVHPAPGTGGACRDPGINPDDAEAAIDVEWASAAAPNAAIVMASCDDTTNFGGFIALQNMLTNGGVLPSVVSISYGEPETESGAAFNSYINTLYQTAAAAGVSVFVSSGDSAAAASDRGGLEAIYGIGVSSFASTTYNVAVGGTDFGDSAAGTSGTFWNSANGVYYNSANSYVPEIPWNDSCASLILANYYGFSTTYGAAGFCNSDLGSIFLSTTGGSGGPSGCATGTPSAASAVSGTCAGYGKPSWQSIAGNPNDGVRDLPDVALFASNGAWGHYYAVCYSDEGGSCTGPPSTWPGFGGTSVSSPIMAGIQTLINQAAGSKNVGNPNPMYYQIGQNEYSTAAGRNACNSSAGPASGCSFNDITQGDMNVPCAGAFNCYLDGQALGVMSTSDATYAPSYGATAGWDFATGIGSVNAYNLLNAFVDSIAPSSAPAAPSLASPANGATGVSAGTALSWNASAGATSYDVYVGTATTPPLVANTPNINYVPSALSPGTTYYWAVGARNSLGANASTAWSFTTGCVAALNPSSATAPAAGGAGAIPVTAATGCEWTAVSNATWITITAGGSGSGNGTVGYLVAADTGAQRVGTITVSGLTFTVTQAIYPLISTLAGGGMPPTAVPGTSVSIPLSYGLAVDLSGNAYFPSPNLNAVFKADSTGMVTRIAGTGAAGYSGDGGPALSAQLNSPNGVAVDSLGNVYIADTNNRRVRKVDISGAIATVAGTGNCCFGGDGGAATSAYLDSPNGLAVDAAGNLYIADTSNQRIREVSAAGTITTLAGNGSSGYSGDGGPAASAELNYPYGLAVDASGNLFIADFGNNRIRKVDTSGNITTAAGIGSCCYSGDGGLATSARLDGPSGVAVDAAGNLYIADTSNNRIRKVSAGIISTLAGAHAGYTGDGGAATGAELRLPEGVAVDASGNLYIADYGNARIRRISATVIATFVGGGLGDGGLGVFGALDQPAGVARDNAGNTYVADSYNNRVRKVAANGTISTVAGTGPAGFSGDGGAAVSAQLNAPQALALDASGNLYIADTGNCRIRKVDGSGKITTVAGNPNGTCGVSLGDGGPATNAQFNAVYGLAVDASGNLYISDFYNSVIRKVTAATGIITTVAGNGTLGYSGDGGAATSAELRNPWGVTVDAFGNLYIADTYNLRIRVVFASGIITTVAGNGNCCYSGDGGLAASAELAYPTGVAVDPSGELYIADYSNNRVRKVTPNGIITTVAGNGDGGYSGDGGPATGATFRNPYYILVDAAGNLAVSDLNNNAVRSLTPAGTLPVLSIQSAHAGNFTAGSTGAYNVTINNSATAGATSGAVTVTETLPAILALASMAGSGWSCAGNTCTRSDSLPGGGSYPPIAVTVNVGAATETQATNLVAVSGGGGAAAGTVDLTLVSQPALLSIAKTHNGHFVQGQTGATYTVTVTSVAPGPTSGLVTVTETMPLGLIPVSMTGTGWTCSSNSCSRSDSLAAASSYPPITVTVDVAANATSPQVNSVSASGGGSAPASATDSAIIDPPCSYTLNFGGQAFPVAGGAGSILVTTSSGSCAWSATSGLSWAAIAAGASGTGSGTVTYQVAANTGGVRSGVLTVAGLPFTVEQASATVSGLVSAGSMAQLASGGLWNTTITLMNTGATAEVVLNFFDDNGNPLPLPLLFPQTSASSSGPVVAATVDQTLGAGAQLVIQTAGTASQANVEGWAQVLANGRNVGGAAVFAWTAAATGSQEEEAPLETRNPTAFVLPFDYTSGYQTGVAVANLSNKAVSIPVILTDNTGASLGTAAAIPLAAYAHTSFMLATNYPAVSGKLGAMELDTPLGGQISALGIRAAPGGAITSVPVLAK